jgi:hypothetical protein
LLSIVADEAVELTVCLHGFAYAAMQRDCLMSGGLQNAHQGLVESLKEGRRGFGVGQRAHPGERGGLDTKASPFARPRAFSFLLQPHRTEPGLP